MRDLVITIMILAGLGGVSVGLWQMHPPTCFVVVGAMLLVTGIVGGLAK